MWYNKLVSIEKQGVRFLPVTNLFGGKKMSQGTVKWFNAGMKVCAVYDEYSKDDDGRKQSMADYYINDYDEIVRKVTDV